MIRCAAPTQESAGTSNPPGTPDSSGLRSIPFIRVATGHATAARREVDDPGRDARVVADESQTMLGVIEVRLRPEDDFRFGFPE